MKTWNENDARKAWWARWREADYTWDGLAGKLLYGWSVRTTGRLVRNEVAPKSARPATLQDLWRSEAGKLHTDADGQTWTAVHAPLYARSGIAFKASWNATQKEAIDKALSDAMGRFPRDAFKTPSPSPASVKRRGSRLTSLGRHWPLRLDGAVLLSIPTSISGLSLFRGDRIAFGEKVVLGADAMNIDLRYPLFERQVTINEAEGQEVRLREPIALRAFYIDNCRLRRLALFAPEVFGDFAVNSAEGMEEVVITRPAFRAEALLDSVGSDKISITHGGVSGDFSLTDLECQTITLAGNSVEGSLLVENLTAGSFLGAALHVEGDATIKNATLSKNLAWPRARLERGASFENLDTIDINLSDVVFGDKLEMKGAGIKGRSDFARAHYIKSAYFNGAALGATTSALSSAFRETRFDSFVDFRGCGAIDFAAFDGANFKAEVRFDQTLFDKDSGLVTSLAAAVTDDRLISLENGLRALKQAAETVRHRAQEQTFYRYELMVRRHQARAGREEVVLSHLYDLVSRHGSSFARPMGAALLLWLLFALIYLLTAVGYGLEDAGGWTLSRRYPLHPAIPEALNLSSRSMFNLFGVWSLRPSLPLAGIEAHLLHGSSGLGFVVRALSSVQSTLAGILLFLTALAARRRFQIN